MNFPVVLISQNWKAFKFLLSINFILYYLSFTFYNTLSYHGLSYLYRSCLKKCKNLERKKVISEKNNYIKIKDLKECCKG